MSDARLGTVGRAAGRRRPVRADARQQPRSHTRQRREHGSVGVLFGFAVLRSHDLWAAIGLHFGWNVTLPFGGAVLSGLTIRVAGYELVWKTGDLWSGGRYGPEASPLTTGVLILMFLLVSESSLHRGWAWLLDEREARPEAVSLDLREPPAP